MSMVRELRNKMVGKIGENIALNWFLMNDFTVYQAVEDIEKIDFIVRKKFGGSSVTPYYFEIQVKSRRGKQASFYVPRQEGKERVGNYFYVFVHMPDEKTAPRIYLLTQEEVKRERYKNTRKFAKKVNKKKFEKRTVVIKLSEEDKKKYDINNKERQHLLVRKNT